jgi:hypothetical protein
VRRIDLPEIEDREWCPAWIRDAMTGYLQAVIELARPYDVAVPVLAELLDETDRSEVIDLASGAGGPWRQLRRAIESTGRTLEVTLTDIAPNDRAIAGFRAEEGIDYLPESVSALDVPQGLRGVRTMFTGLHHFSPDEVRSILASAQQDRVGFAAFEATQRSWRGLFVALFIPLFVLALMPRVRPRRLLPLVLTYVPPVLPLLIWWDGFASTLRTYTAAELRELAAAIEVPGYAWRVEEVGVRGAPIPVLQVTGRPTAPCAAPSID